MSELGLVVIWPRHLKHVDAITRELKDRFIIIEHYDIQWNKEIFYQNFYRFYGDKEPFFLWSLFLLLFFTPILKTNKKI